MVNFAAIAVAVGLLAAGTPTTDTFTTAEYAAGTAIEWIVPEGVTSLTLTAAGGDGGAFVPTRPGGRGAVLTLAVDVSPGQSLTIVLGADGLQSGEGGAGYGLGGTGLIGGGGGGSTAVLIDGEVVLLAAGGGGSGGSALDGGGGAGGTPVGGTGTRNSGVGGSDGAGGAGRAPWGGPGGAGFRGSGGSVGNDNGAGGGAGWGGGGAGGSLGDGAGGGSYPSTLDPTAYALRDDASSGGWVRLDYEAPAPSPSPTPVVPAEPSDTVLGVDSTLLGVIAGVIVGSGIVLIIGTAIVRSRRRRGGR